MSHKIDMIGKRFGRLGVIEEVEPHIKPSGQKIAMYKCICETYDYVSKDLGINIMIRSGDAIESAINKYGEHFHKDGFHLNDAGRYIAALTFVHTFNNKPIKKLYIPESLTKDQCQKYEELVLKSL